MYLTFIALFLTALVPLSGNLSGSPLLAQEKEPELIVYNRVLAKINGKTFSVVDVMKKMDLFLQKNYPHMVGSKAACFQFYSSQWKDTLTQMINDELILEDAGHLELKITDADVREEIMQRFGPNVMLTLDSLNLTYDEAKQLVHSDLVVQQMMWFRVHAKALTQVTPEEIKTAYQEYCKKNPSSKEWEYEVLSLRSTNRSLGEALAHKACDLLKGPGTLETTTKSEEILLTNSPEQAPPVLEMSLAAIAENLKKEAQEGVVVSLNSDLKADDRSLAKSHREVLESLQLGAYSEPIAQVSRSDQSVVHRIFHLKKISSKTVPPFERLASNLKEELLSSASSKEHSQYIAKLRAKLGYDENHILEKLPPDFQPFTLR